MNDEMRKEFEAWAGQPFTYTNLTKSDDGEWYMCNETQDAWCGFQAAYQLQQERIEELEGFVHRQLTDLNQSRAVNSVSYYKFWAYKEVEQFLLSQTKGES